jgi:hypothetical protein
MTSIPNVTCISTLPTAHETAAAQQGQTMGGAGASGRDQTQSVLRPAAFTR